MKKSFTLASLSTLFLLMASCGVGENEYHHTAFYPDGAYGRLLYADQTRDTLHVLSYDPWTASAIGTWFTISPESQSIPPGQGTLTPIYITAQPNTTGIVRSGRIQVSGYSQISTSVTQVYWHDILNPTPVIEQKNGMESEVTCKVSTELAAADERLPLVFRTYADVATLTTDAAWITIPDTVFHTGYHTYAPTVQKNPGTEARTATLTLTSAGISTPITVTQQGKRNDN